MSKRSKCSDLPMAECVYNEDCTWRQLGKTGTRPHCAKKATSAWQQFCLANPDKTWAECSPLYHELKAEGKLGKKQTGGTYFNQHGAGECFADPIIVGIIDKAREFADDPPDPDEHSAEWNISESIFNRFSEIDSGTLSDIECAMKYKEILKLYNDYEMKYLPRKEPPKAIKAGHVKKTLWSSLGKDSQKSLEKAGMRKYFE